MANNLLRFIFRTLLATIYEFFCSGPPLEKIMGAPLVMCIVMWALPQPASTFKRYSQKHNDADDVSCVLTSQKSVVFSANQKEVHEDSPFKVGFKEKTGPVANSLLRDIGPTAMFPLGKSAARDT